MSDQRNRTSVIALQTGGVGSAHGVVKLAFGGYV